ncbi:duf895 domain membrane protein [Phaffia rhodozyma]|uniref:Duf895 domain membrane protein n=1 Tax=Phaffia rhodozyma TaxID=264483 RepID=A0A0F7SM46_PHARH|nr:duf895 domain membrane protein [Phaffia rhodozyma]
MSVAPPELAIPEATGHAQPGSSWKKVPFFRSVQFAVLIAGLVTFSAPGMFDAMGNLGAGGAAEPYAVNAANALVYGLMVIFCITAGGLINVIGLKWALVLGTVGYPLYSAGLYTNSYSSNTWFLLFGSAFCGISAGFFWAAEATVYIGYPEPGEKGRYLAQWAFWKNLAPAIGGAVNLGVNVSTNQTGAISRPTYIVFIVIMCLGFPISMFLPSPQRVMRKDGTNVPSLAGKGVVHEIWAVLRLLKEKKILFLLPAFISSYFYLAYQSNYLGLHFTVRTRALSSLVAPFAGIISSYAMGYFLDQRQIPVRTRGAIVLGILFVMEMGVWIWATVMQHEFDTKNMTIDWSSKDFGRAWTLVFFWTFIGQALQNYLYWVISHFATDINALSRYAGLFRSMEALGQTIGWAIASNASISPYALIGLNFGGLFVAFISATPIVLSLVESDIDSAGAFGVDSRGKVDGDGEASVDPAIARA